MVTKAELEIQVAELRQQLAQLSRDKEPDTSAASEERGTKEPGPRVEDWAESFRHLPAQIEEALSELEDLPHKKPILFALGVFALGYVIGRSR